MKSKWGTVALYGLLLAGLLLLNYPAISNVYNQLMQAQIISEADMTLKEKSEAELRQIKAAAIQYNERLYEEGGNGIIDAFAVADQKMDQKYASILDPAGNGIMAYIEIPAIQVYLPVYHGTTAAVLEKGVGHLEGTSLPIGGENTHAVLSAHRGVPSAVLFTNADQLKVGDTFYIDALLEKTAYEIDQVKTVLPTEVEDLKIEAGKDYVTLVTCTPYGINSHRLLIRGKRIPYEGTLGEPAIRAVKTLWQWLLEQKVLLLSVAVVLLWFIWQIKSGLQRRFKRGRIRRSKDENVE